MIWRWKGVVVRWRALVTVLVTIAGIVAAHRDALGLPGPWNGRAEVIGLIIVALHNAPIGRYVEPRHEPDS